MAKFCGKCGSKLDDTSGLCPNCDAAKLNKQTEKPKAFEPPKQLHGTAPEPKMPLSKKEAKKQRKADKKAAKKAKKKEKWAAKSFGQKFKSILLKIVLWLLLIVFLAGVSIIALALGGLVKLSYIEEAMSAIGLELPANDGLAHSVDELEDIRIGEAIRGKSQVLSTIQALSSLQIMPEKTVQVAFSERGFVDVQITTSYAMDGTYYDEQTISATSDDYHPIYSAIYISADDFCWVVYCCNGEWSAVPVSYLYSGLAKHSSIVSEHNYLMSYDSTTNCFYKIIPDANECVIVSVTQIDAATLDSLAEKEFQIT